MCPDPHQPQRAVVVVNPAKADDAPAVRDSVTSGMRDGDPIRHTNRTVVVANLAILPSEVALLPDPPPDDNTVEVALIESDNLADWLHVTSRVMTGRTRVDDRHTPRHPQHTQISMRASHPRQADGDRIGDGLVMGGQMEAGALGSLSPPLPRDRRRATTQRTRRPPAGQQQVD